MIVFAWGDDERTRRAYESSDDACRVFGNMLGIGHPLDDWAQLLAATRTEGERLNGLVSGAAQTQP